LYFKPRLEVENLDYTVETAGLDRKHLEGGQRGSSSDRSHISPNDWSGNAGRVLDDVALANDRVPTQHQAAGECQRSDRKAERQRTRQETIVVGQHCTDGIGHICIFVVINTQVPVATQIGEGSGSRARRRSAHDNLLSVASREETAAEIRCHRGRHILLEQQISIAGEIVEFKQNSGDGIGNLELEEEPTRWPRRSGKQAIGERNDERNPVGQRNNNRRIGSVAGLDVNEHVGGTSIKDADVPAIGLDGERRVVSDQHDYLNVRARLLADVVIMIEIWQRQVFAQDHFKIAIGTREPERHRFGWQTGGGSIRKNIKLEVARNACRADEVGNDQLTVGKSGDVKPDSESEGDADGIGVSHGEIVSLAGYQGRRAVGVQSGDPGRYQRPQQREVSGRRKVGLIKENGKRQRITRADLLRELQNIGCQQRPLWCWNHKILNAVGRQGVRIRQPMGESNDRGRIARGQTKVEHPVDQLRIVGSWPHPIVPNL